MHEINSTNDAPAGWRAVQVGSLVEFKNGLNFGADQKGTGTKIIGVGDFGDAFTIDFCDLDLVNIPATRDDSVFLKDGDLLFVRSNGNKALIGRVLIIRGIQERIAHSGFTIRARLTSGDARPDYLASFFASSVVKRQFHRLGGGTNISNLSQDTLAQVEIPLPPLCEQDVITEILSASRRLCETTQKIDRCRRQVKRGLMQQLLTGERRFPEFQDEPWFERKLGDLFTERSELGRLDLPLLSITATRGIVARDTLVRGDTSSADKSKYKRIAPGDLGYNTMRMWQGVSALSTLEGIVSPAYTVCVPGPEVHGPYFAHLFKSAAVVHRFGRFSQGLVNDTLNLKFPVFSSIAVTIPSVAEQIRIAEVLDTADREIQFLIDLHGVLQEQKKGLMQQLLTGKVCVPASMMNPQEVC